MKNHLLRNLNSFLICLIAVSLSCEKIENDYNNEYIVVKSQEITGYVYAPGEGASDLTDVIPCKLYVKGGAPAHDKGDYHYKIAAGSFIPDGLSLDSITGVIFSDGNSLNPEIGWSEFEVEVTDGAKTAKSKCILNTQVPDQGVKITLPIFQFTSPETNLISNEGSGYFAASFSVMGGTPPYSFSLAERSKLPGKLTLNPVTGVIAGDISKLKSGEYDFQIVCTDVNGCKAISFCTAGNYEEFKLIIR